MKSFAAACLLLAGVAAGVGADGWEGENIFLTWENDATVGTDRHYTQGARVGWWSRDQQLPGFLKSLNDHIPTFGFTDEAQKWGLAAGQEIYTPEDLTTAKLIPTDRPYAGWLCGSLGLQRRGAATPAWLTMETFRLDLGVIGPASLAEQTQKAWHNNPPKGWDNQLRNEPGLILSYDRRYLWSIKDRDERWGMDFIPHFGANLGNVSTCLAAGPLLRFGINIPNEFATGPSTPTKWGAYLYLGATGKLVARNIFLDGNTFVHSQRVDKEPLVGDFKVGLTLVLKNVELTAGHTLLTREFTGQKALDSYSTATVTIKF